MNVAMVHSIKMEENAKKKNYNCSLFELYWFFTLSGISVNDRMFTDDSEFRGLNKTLPFLLALDRFFTEVFLVSFVSTSNSASL